MTQINALVNGNRTTSLEVLVPRCGVWRVDADLDSLIDAASLSGSATVEIGSLSLTGVFSPRTGSFQLQSKCRVVGGKGLWGTVLRARQYHSDSGIKLATVVSDIIREAGETAGTSTLTTQKFAGVDFVRQAAAASQVLSQCLGTTAWWVDYTGATNIGTRAATEITGAYEVLDFDPRLKVATIATDEPDAIMVGSIIRQRMVTPIEVKELSIAVSGGKLRITAWGRDYA